MPHLIRSLISFFIGGLFVLAPHFAMASDADSKFIVDAIKKSNCTFDADFFQKEFSAAIDKLNVLNPAVVTSIRTVSYSSEFHLACDVPRDGEGGIYFSHRFQTIHLWENSPTSERTVSNFFHEFLHFAGVKVDENHNTLEDNNFVEVDSVYACQFAVFPKAFDHLQIDPRRLIPATEKCRSAVIDNLED